MELCLCLCVCFLIIYIIVYVLYGFEKNKIALDRKYYEEVASQEAQEKKKLLEEEREKNLTVYRKAKSEYEDALSALAKNQDSTSKLKALDKGRALIQAYKGVRNVRGVEGISEFSEDALQADMKLFGAEDKPSDD